MKAQSSDHLPDAELEVLAGLWKMGAATARDLRESLEPFRPMSHGAMVTLLNRLEEKGFVTKKKGPVGKAFVYSPTRGPKPTFRRIMRETCERIFGGSGIAMVTSLFETRPPTGDELDKLQQLLDDLRQNKDSKGKKS